MSTIVRWFGQPRVKVFNAIQDKKFILQENINALPSRSENHFNFYLKIASSKFAICPRGTGIDTYRLWDCLYLGCIPIVEKYDGHEDWKDLPIYFVDSLDFYKTVTEEMLHTKYEEMLSTEYNFNKLSFFYWTSRIQSLEKVLLESI